MDHALIAVGIANRDVNSATSSVAPQNINSAIAVEITLLGTPITRLAI